MQIITGKYRARKLKAVNSLSTRPTLARVKEAIFNIIQNKIAGSVVLDLFAGSGAFGAECISRGAKKVYFVDSSAQAISVIKENTRAMSEDFEILQSDFLDALKLFSSKGEKFDLIYLDPPYKSDFISVSLEQIANLNLLNDGGIVVLEHSNENELQKIPKHYIIKRSKKYGIAFVDVLEFLTKE